MKALGTSMLSIVDEDDVVVGLRTTDDKEDASGMSTVGGRQA
jgi:hypothetical protein